MCLRIKKQELKNLNGSGGERFHLKNGPNSGECLEVPLDHCELNLSPSTRRKDLEIFLEAV